MFIIFYGPEGSGKSTQAKMLAEKLKLPYLGSGDLVRKYAEQDKGIMGDICREALSVGHYVADSEMFVLWKVRLKEADVVDGFILDGFPRNKSQALFLAEKLDKYGKKLNLVFYLEVSEAESIKRLAKRGRTNPDGSLHDTPEKIADEIKKYGGFLPGIRPGRPTADYLNHVLNFYKEQGLLKTINGEQSIEAIFKDIEAVVSKA